MAPCDDGSKSASNIQSESSRIQTTAAAKAGLKCALLHCAWTRDAGPNYRAVGNVLLSHIMGADLYIEETERPIDDQGPLEEFVTHLKGQGHTPYLIPGGASEHRLGCMGYIECVSDDNEIDIKKLRVRQLANNALQELGLAARVAERDVEVISSNTNAYGVPDKEIISGIQLLARTEGLIADPVYEGRPIRGLMNLAREGRIESNSKILLMHLGGSPAVHAYAGQFGSVQLQAFAG